MKEPSKSVVLGASGFLGINLTAELTRRGSEVICFSRTRSEHWPRGARYISGDLATPPRELLDTMRDAVVFHLASPLPPRGSTAVAVQELVESVAATLRLLETARDLGCRWVFSSSGGTVYGHPNAGCLAEDHPTNPISSYGISKLSTEKYFHLYRVMHGLDYAVARISNAYGPWQTGRHGQGLVAIAFLRILAGEVIEIWGNGEQIRDYVYVDDVVTAMIALAERRDRSEAVYNVGTGQGHSINQVIAKISGLVGRKAIVAHRGARSIDIACNVLDITRAGRELGWTPRTSLDPGLEMTYRWLSR